MKKENKEKKVEPNTLVNKTRFAGARACNHRFHFVRMIPDTGWWSEDSSVWFGARRYIATFICEHCGFLKQIKTKEEE